MSRDRGRLLRASESELPGTEPRSEQRGEFGAFLREVSGAVDEVLRERLPEQRLADAIMRWEGDGFRTTRLEAALAGGPSADDADDVIASFENDVARLIALTDEMRTLDAAAPELARADVLRDPDRVDAAEQLVTRVRGRLDPARPVDAARAVAVPEVGVADGWFLSREKVVWRWPYVDDAIVLQEPE